MKIRRILFIVMAVLFCSTVCHAQTKDEISLVVSGDGANKEEATKVALRSAIEQAYGTFVSTNTSIVDDELIKDEIATVSSGNIKLYEEIDYTVLPDGRSSVTLKAIVCPSKLVSYAQSKGARTELAGATFAMNMKMYELNKQNEEIAFDNLKKQIRLLLPNAFDRNLEIKDPRISKYNDKTYDVEFIVKIKCNETTEVINKLIRNTLYSLTLTSKEVAAYKKTGITVYPLIYSTVANASSHTSVEDFENFNPKDPVYGRPDKGGPKAAFVDYYYTKVLYFRNEDVLWNIMTEFAHEINNFVIKDNTGQESMVYSGIFANNEKNRYRQGSSLVRIEQHGFDAPLKVHLPIRGYANMLRIIATIPKEDIQKYSSFDIMRAENVQLPIK